MNVAGITIDERRIAEGIYDLFTDQDRTVCAFGMLPADKMESLQRMLGEKFEEIAKEQCRKAFGWKPEGNVANQKMKAQFVREVEHAVCVEIYGVAKENGMLVV